MMKLKRRVKAISKRFKCNMMWCVHGTYSRLVNSALRDYAEQCFNNWVEKKVEALNDKLEDKSRLWEVVSSKMDKYDIDYDIIYERCVVPKGCLEVKREVEVIDKFARQDHLPLGSDSSEPSFKNQDFAEMQHFQE